MQTSFVETDRITLAVLTPIRTYIGLHQQFLLPFNRSCSPDRRLIMAELRPCT
jgi:hypothetical protein